MNNDKNLKIEEKNCTLYEYLNNLNPTVTYLLIEIFNGFIFAYPLT